MFEYYYKRPILWKQRYSKLNCQGKRLLKTEIYSLPVNPDFLDFFWEYLNEDITITELYLGVDELLKRYTYSDLCTQIKFDV